MGLGYCLMAVHDLKVLYVAMTLVIFGNGLFKPNISTLLGNVYSTPQYNSQKMKAIISFTWELILGLLFAIFRRCTADHAWMELCFLAAGIGMFIGVLIFIIGTKHYAEFDLKKEFKKEICLLKSVYLY